jgi:hypothetical protein
VGAFAAAGAEPPRAALLAAEAAWDSVGPRLAALTADYAAGLDRSERTERALFYAVPMLAGARTRPAFAPLCALLDDPEAADLVLGDAITETLPSMLAALYDGDLGRLQAVIENEAGAEHIRHAAFRALTFLAWSGEVAAAGMRAFLARTRTGMRPRGPSLVWVAWADAAIDLGWRDLAAEAEALCRTGFITPDHLRASDIRAELQAVLDDPARLRAFPSPDVWRFGPGAEELQAWFERTARSEQLAAEEDARAQPVANPLRHVGRNDPCPCGSGRKYKSCCGKRG